MNRIIIPIILLISVISCKGNSKKISENLSKKSIQIEYQKKDSISNFSILSKIDKQIQGGKTKIKTYKTLDSIKKHIDGADAEYYIEIYKNAVLSDTKTFNSYYLKVNKSIDKDVISFFSEDKSILEQICSKVNISLLKNFETAIIQDEDGYTNLRKGQSVKTNVIDKVKSGDEIKILNESEDWNLVFTGNNVGYIHKSRLLLK